MSLSLKDIGLRHEKNISTATISYQTETCKVGILSQQKASLRKLASMLAVLKVSNQGQVIFSDLRFQVNTTFITNTKIGYISDDWGFLKKLSFSESMLLFKEILFKKDKLKFPAFIQNNFRLKIAFTQLFLSKTAVWVFDCLDFSKNLAEWLAYFHSFDNSKTMILLSDSPQAIESICHEAILIDQENVIGFGKTKDLLDELENIVWQKEIDKTDIEKYDEAFFILKKVVKDHTFGISVLSKEKPCEGFFQEKPSLEVLLEHKIILNKLESS